MNKVVVSIIAGIVVIGGGIFGGVKYYNKVVHDNKVEAMKLWDKDVSVLGKDLNKISSKDFSADVLAGDTTTVDNALKETDQVKKDLETAKGFQYSDMVQVKDQGIKSADAKIALFTKLRKVIMVVKTSGILAASALGNDYTTNEINAAKTEGEKANKLHDTIMKQLGMK